MSDSATVLKPDTGEPPSSAIIKPRKAHIWTLISFLSVLCLGLAYYDMFIMKATPYSPPVPQTTSNPSMERSGWSIAPVDEGFPVGGGREARPDYTAPPVPSGGDDGGLMSMGEESHLTATIRNSTVAKIIHVGVLLIFLVSIISYGLRLGFLVVYSELLQPSWITIGYGGAHLVFAILSMINWTIVGHSFFTNQDHDFYSKLGSWAPTFFYIVVSAFFCFDMAMYVYPEQLELFNLEGFFETVTVMMGKQADLPEWLQVIMHDGHVLNPIGVCSHLFGTLVAASYALTLAIQLTANVHSSVQVMTIIITLVSTCMSGCYSMFRMIIPTKQVSMAVQILYLLISIGGIVYGLRGNVWSWQSLITLLLMISQLRTCLNLGFTNSSLFWTLISPFYVEELYV